MKKLIIALAAMALTLSAPAQTKKTTTAKKSTTTATAKKSTTAKTTGTTAKKSTSTTSSKTTTTAKKSAATTTAKKSSTTTAAKKSTTTSKPATTTTQPAQSTAPAVQRHQEAAPAPRQQQQAYRGQEVRQPKHRNEGWNEVYHHFGPTFVSYRDVEKVDGDLDWEEKTSGTPFLFTTGYNHAFPLSQSIPLYLRGGASLDFAICSQDLSYKIYGDYGWETERYPFTAYMFSAKLNLDLGYKIPIAGGRMHIMPYAGFDAKFNIAGHYDFDGDDGSIFDPKVETYDSEGYYDDEKNLISRVQGGFHIGADMYLLRHLVVGMSFQFYTPLFHDHVSYDEEYYYGGRYGGYYETEHMDYKTTMTQTALLFKAGFVW